MRFLNPTFKILITARTASYSLCSFTTIWNSVTVLILGLCPWFKSIAFWDIVLWKIWGFHSFFIVLWSLFKVNRCLRGTYHFRLQGQSISHFLGNKVYKHSQQLWDTYLPIHWIPGVKQPEHEADPPCMSAAKVRNITVAYFILV